MVHDKSGPTDADVETPSRYCDERVFKTPSRSLEMRTIDEVVRLAFSTDRAGYLADPISIFSSFGGIGK